MGTFTVTAHISGAPGRGYRSFEALVDTGATYAVFPGDALHELGVRLIERCAFELAGERVVKFEVGEARLRFDERQHTVLVVMGPNDVSPLIGATTLELIGLAPDPVHKGLVPVRGLLKGFGWLARSIARCVARGPRRSEL